MDTLELNFIRKYSEEGYDFTLAREAHPANKGFYAIRERNPLFCFFDKSESFAVQKARRAIRLYAKEFTDA